MLLGEGVYLKRSYLKLQYKVMKIIYRNHNFNSQKTDKYSTPKFEPIEFDFCQG